MLLKEVQADWQIEWNLCLKSFPYKEKAPAGWSGKGLISFFARNASGNYMETIRIASDAVKDAFDGMMD